MWFIFRSGAGQSENREYENPKKPVKHIRKWFLGESARKKKLHNCCMEISFTFFFIFSTLYMAVAAEWTKSITTCWIVRRIYGKRPFRKFFFIFVLFCFLPGHGWFGLRFFFFFFAVRHWRLTTFFNSQYTLYSSLQLTHVEALCKSSRYWRHAGCGMGVSISVCRHLVKRVKLWMLIIFFVFEARAGAMDNQEDTWTQWRIEVDANEAVPRGPGL